MYRKRSRTTRRVGRRVRMHPTAVAPRPSSAQPRARGSRVSYAKTHTGTRAGTRSVGSQTQKNKTEGAGGYVQWTKRRYTMGQRISPATMDKRLVRANREYQVLGWRNLKSFSGFGAIPIFSQGGGDAKYQPFHVYSLNSQIQFPVPRPARGLYFNDATNKWVFRELSGLTADNVASPDLQVLKTSLGYMNQQKQYHESSTVKLNLWGAKSRPVRWTIDIVIPKTTDVDPWHYAAGAALSDQAAQSYEELLKDRTFNPLSRMDHRIRNNFKIIKTISWIMGPISTTEADSDPHVKTINLFIRRNAIVNYDRLSDPTMENTLEDGDDLKTARNHALGATQNLSIHPRHYQHLLMFVRASDYTAPADNFNNAIHGSYDCVWETKFTNLS